MQELYEKFAVYVLMAQYKDGDPEIQDIFDSMGALLTWFA